MRATILPYTAIRCLTMVWPVTTFSGSATAYTLYFQLTSAADIAGRSVVVYAGSSPSTADAAIVGSAAGPASGHVALGTLYPSGAGGQGGGAVLYHACLTSADRSKDGWSLGMVCSDVAAALITMTN